MKYDFTSIIDRSADGSSKWAGMKKINPNVGPDVLPMSTADMEFMIAPEIREGLKKHIDTVIPGYTNPTPAYFESVLRWQKERHNYEGKAEWIVTTSGVVQAFVMLTQLLTEPGDGIIIQQPVYYPFAMAPKMSGRKLVNNPLICTGDTYVIDYEDLEEKAKGDGKIRHVGFSYHGPKEEFEEVVDSALGISKSTLNGQTDIFSMLSEDDAESLMPKFEYPDMEEFSKKEILLYEKEVTGIYFSGHILDAYKKHMTDLNLIKISELLANDENEKGHKDKENVKVAGIVTSRTVKQTKNGENMAFITIEDQSGSIEIVVFPNSFKKFEYMYYTENVIWVKGTLSLRDDEKPKIILNYSDNVFRNVEYTSAPKMSKLYLKVSSINLPVVTEITDILKDYKGDTEVIFYDASTKKYVKATEIKIFISEDIIDALKEILGNDSVILK